MRFFEVFRTLKLPEEIGMYLDDVEVVKVSKTSTNSMARIYIQSDRLIDKQLIYKAEDALKKQVFRMKNMDVRIIDRYRLSKQYTPQSIMEVYYDSMMFEMEKYWTLEYNLLKNSSWEFETEDRLVITLEDGFLSRTYAESLADYFKKIFLNRFGFEIDVIYEYAKKESNHYERENEHKLSLRVAEIEKNMRAAMGDSSGSDNEKKKEKNSEDQSDKKNTTKKSGDSGKSAGDKSANNGKFGNGTFYKKPNNDDVLYGRDFDDEAIAIEQIDNAIGEIVIDGMIRKVDEREIRNERTILMFDVTDFTDTITVKMFVKNEELSQVKEYIKTFSAVKNPSVKFKV
ncbi:MAG: hypothetical protein IJB96_00495 [Lachnospira sp.]|nr:hypothetical protein [Lachnospira sp.]